MSPDAQTYTWPLALMVVLILLGIGALAVLYNRKRTLQAAVEEKFTGFRAQAVGLMDQLDALRERHRTLLKTDPDFTEPMAGGTLALYNAVETDLNNLWDRWLKVMELWDQAQKLVRSSSGLAVRQTEEARKLLDQGNIDDLLHQSASCKERLDRLNQGHEQARESLELGRKDLARALTTTSTASGKRPSSDSRDAELSRVNSMFDQAESLLTADPIGADELIARARRAISSVDRAPGDRPNWAPLPKPAYSLLDELGAAADAFRNAAAKLRLTNLLGVFVRFWMVVWGFSLLFGLLNFLMPLIILGVAFFVVIAGFWAFWQFVTFWFWYAMWGSRR